MSRCFVIISDSFWEDTFWVSRHYIAYELAKLGYPTIFVEKPITVISPFVYKDTPFKRLFSNGKLRNINENLKIYRPRPRLPFDRLFTFFSKWNQIILAKEIHSIRDSIGELVIISFDHRVDSLFKKRDKKTKVIYYVVDEISEFKWPMTSKRKVIEQETTTIQNSDMVIASSNMLLSKSQKLNKKSFLISHGVDVFKYEGSQFPLPIDMKLTSDLKIGFLGKLEDWVDLRLLSLLAERFPEASLILIGNSKVSIEDLAARQNVFYLGTKSREEIPQYLFNWSVGIIPFKQTELVKSVNPLKLFEYLAAGLPVVTTDFPSVRNLEHLDVYTAESHKVFLTKIERALKGSLNSNVDSRKAFARRNSWQAKASQLLDLIDSNLYH